MARRPLESSRERSVLRKSVIRKRTRRLRTQGLHMERLEERRLLVGQPFQMAILETGTPVPEFNNGQYTMAVADWDLDGQEDMFAIKTKSTASGKVEVSVYSARATFKPRSPRSTLRYLQPLPIEPIASFNPVPPPNPNLRSLIQRAVAVL